MKHLIIFFALLLTLSPSLLRAQDQEEVRPNLRLVARSYGDSVVLRWGTTTHTAWKVAGSKGYIIERVEVRGAEQTPVPRKLTPSPIKPLTLEEWKARYRQDDTLAGAAVQALYGKPVVTSEDPFGSIYEIYLQQKNMFGFALLLSDLAPRIADGLGLRFVDRDIDRNRSYVYRIYSLANNPDQPIDTAFVVVTAGDVVETPSVESITANEGEKEVVLTWDRYEHIRPFTGYYIERSTDGGRSFTRVNHLPFIPAENEDDDARSNGKATYRVPQEANYRPAQYRVVGIDAFGEASPRSRTIVAMGRDRTAPRQAEMLPLEIVAGRSIKVSWKVDSVEGDLRGFYVGKSEDVDGPFESIGEILPRDTREFIDRNVNELPQHYYVVVAVDTAGNVRNSVPLLGMFPDSIAPAVPTGLTGTVDSNGIVVLRWNPNEEQDLHGYRVFYANQDDHEYQQLTTDLSTDTLFRDTLTLRTLSETIHYKVVALDRNFNHSEFSPVLTIQKPDIVAPAPPLVTDVTVDDRGVTLAWQLSPSSDMAEHILYRRMTGQDTWQIMARSGDRSFTTFTDTSAEKGVLYEYSLDARDDAGLASLRSNVVTGRAYSSGVRLPVEGVTHTIDKEKRRIVVRWNAPASGTERIYLYKGVGTGAPSLYQSLDGTVMEFTDAEIFTGTTYRYGVKVVTSAGEESEMAMTGEIDY